MTQVVIQPSYGNPDAWRHWEDTLDREVPYATGTYAQALLDDELARLNELHPLGRARFWGATGNHDAKMSTLRTGDVVLFTGKKLVRAVGEVGHSFRNAVFADRLWDPHSERGSYRNVYSLLAFQTTTIPYEEVWDLPGFNVGDMFMGLRFLDPDKSASVLDGLAIETATAAISGAEEERRLAAALGATLVAPEAMNTTSTTYNRPGGTTLVHRAEALLVAAYRDTLDDADVGRLRTSTGITDLYIRSDSGVELVEAKRSADHGFVRDALGQLLDYVVHAPEPVDRLTALFPKQPSEADVALLHRYGVDSVSRCEDGTFTRLAAPDEQRLRAQTLWQA